MGKWYYPFLLGEMCSLVLASFVVGRGCDLHRLFARVKFSILKHPFPAPSPRSLLVMSEFQEATLSAFPAGRAFCISFPSSPSTCSGPRRSTGSGPERSRTGACRDGTWECSVREVSLPPSSAHFPDTPAERTPRPQNQSNAPAHASIFAPPAFFCSRQNSRAFARHTTRPRAFESQRKRTMHRFHATFSSAFKPAIPSRCCHSRKFTRLKSGLASTESVDTLDDVCIPRTIINPMTFAHHNHHIPPPFFLPNWALTLPRRPHNHHVRHARSSSIQ